MSQQSNSDIEALLSRPALRLGPAFGILGVGNTTGFKWIKAGILDRFYIDEIPYITTASIKRAMRAHDDASA